MSGLSIWQFDPVLIDPNPWQSRLADDPVHIQSLAGSIRENGLLQTPLGRFADEKRERVQLAFGHSRLAAWKLACPGEPFPVETRELSDRQMSDLAAEENSRRKNLTAIETARAIQRRIADFGLTQLEAGRPFGYANQGSVANLLRLLKLPEPVQAHVQSGALPERLGRELLLVARLNSKTAGEIADAAVKVDARDRGEFVSEKIGGILWNKGRRLGDLPCEPDWPKTPIKIETPDTVKGEPAEIPACTGCRFHFEHDHLDLCANPACFDLKRRLALVHVVNETAKRLKIPAAVPSEKVVPIFDGKVELKAFQDGYIGSRYRRGSENVNKVVRAQLPELRLIPAPKDSWELKSIFGSPWVGLGATNKAEVERWLERKTATAKTDGAKAAAPTSHFETAAQKAARVEREERLAAERRAERVTFLKYRTDTIWLIETVARLIAERTMASGGLLAWMDEFVDDDYRYNIGEKEWSETETRLADAIKAGQDVDLARRQHLALNVLVHELTDRVYKPVEIYDYGKAHRAARGLAQRFGVELPAGWDELPIHHTPFNCWTCGRFSGNSNGLTKAEQAAGWSAITQGKTLISVQCPEHSKDPRPPAPKVPGASTGKLSKRAKQKQKA